MEYATRDEFIRLDHDVNGNGREGLRDIVTDLKLQLTSHVSAQEASDKANRRWFAAIGAITMAVFVTLLGILAFIAESRIKTGHALFSNTVAVRRNIDVKNQH